MNFQDCLPPNKYKYYIFYLFILFSRLVKSHPEDSIKFQKTTAKIKIGVLPSLFYTPETRLGFGGFVYTLFKFNKRDTSHRKSITQSYLTYTLNRQFAFENDYQLWMNNNRLYLSGAMDYTRFPQLYFGIGNATKKSDQFTISFDLFRIRTKNLIHIGHQMYAGFTFHYEHLHNQDMNFKNNNMNRETYGSMGYRAIGIGPIFILDRRNNLLNPSKGDYFEVSYMDYENVFNNEHMFYSLLLDARKYYTCYKKLVWNGNIYFNFNSGQVPYNLLPQLGGPRFLRGYYRGRFRDNNMYVIQQELRMPVYKRLGFAVFGGLGSVSKKISDLKNNTVHYNYGLGLRIKVNKKDDSNFRIDYGMTKDSHGLYIIFAEAF